MSSKKRWDELCEEASNNMQRWRAKHKKATLTAIEDLALESATADLTALPAEERPPCPQCGRPLVANGRQRRELVTAHEQGVVLERSKGYCRHCQRSFFPSG